MSLSSIIVKGARVHNLKNIDVTVPRDRFVVFTGLSGSGKSSLAFDTIYAEGHRRFVESLSSYARMFLGQLDKPDVDLIEGLSPAKKNGYVRVRVDGEMYDVNDIPELEKNKKHTVDIVVDRLVMKEGIRGRLTDSAETALNLAKGNLHIVTVGDTPEEYRYSQNYACEEHGFSMGELSPRMFSFNNPYGACERCAGIGELRTVSFDLICPDRSLSLADGAVAVNGFKSLDDSTWTAPLFTS